LLVKKKMFLLLLFFACLSFVAVVCQNPSMPGAALQKEFQKAKLYYDSATQLYATEGYTEQKEKALNERALQLFKTLLPKVSAGGDPGSVLTYQACFAIGELEHYFEQVDSALLYYNKAAGLQLHHRLPDSLSFKPYLYSGLIYYDLGKLDSAAGYFLKAEQINDQYRQGLQESERLYNTLGVIHYEMGNYKSAENYFTKALEALSPYQPYYQDLLVNYKINLAQIKFKLEEYEEAMKMYRELFSFNKHLDDINNNVGIIHLNLGAAAKALSYFRKVHYTGQKQVILYNNIGRTFLALNQRDSAKSYFNQALQLKVSGESIGMGQTFKNLGDLELMQDRPEKAIDLYNKALRQFYPKFRADKGLNPQTFSGVFSYTHLFDALVAKAAAYDRLYLKSKKLEWASEELETYQSAFRLVEYVQRMYTSDEARLFINHFKYEVHAKPIDIAYTLYKETGDRKYLQNLYEFDQQNKASVLAVNQLQNQPTSEMAGKKKEELQLKQELTRLSLKAEKTEPALSKNLRKSIRDLEIRIEKLQQRFEVSGAGKRLPTITQLQKELLGNTSALVSYHLAPDKLTTLIITKKHAYVKQQKLWPSFSQDFHTYLSGLRQPQASTPSSIEQKLYEVLCSEIDGHAINHLILIPDDELIYLPFEALQDLKGRFLFQKYSIQYQYSTSSLQKQYWNFTQERSLAVAPFASASGSRQTAFSPLAYSAKEIEDLKGKKLSGNMATKHRFLQEVSQYGIVHLATHAVASEQSDSYIAFFGAKEADPQTLLYTKEIYNLSLNKTQLVVLSACESGAGALVRGEGVMSLSRAFSYAGCPNIITTLWKADDFSTAYIIAAMYKFLKKGWRVDKALQKAKQTYLSDASIHPRMKHPYYWAHLVFVGNYQVTEERSTVYFFVAGLCVLFGIVWFFWKKRKARF
jgi:CHAT domain-containing protein/Tfp pilus assembly protein PilF